MNFETAWVNFLRDIHSTAIVELLKLPNDEDDVSCDDDDYDEIMIALKMMKAGHERKKDNEKTRQKTYNCSMI